MPDYFPSSLYYPTFDCQTPFYTHQLLTGPFPIAPVPRKKEGRAARLQALMDRDGHAGGPAAKSDTRADDPSESAGAAVAGPSASSEPVPSTSKNGTNSENQEATTLSESASGASDTK